MPPSAKRAARSASAAAGRPCGLRAEQVSARGPAPTRSRSPSSPWRGPPNAASAAQAASSTSHSTTSSWIELLPNSMLSKLAGIVAHGRGRQRNARPRTGPAPSRGSLRRGRRSRSGRSRRRSPPAASPRSARPRAPWRARRSTGRRSGCDRSPVSANAPRFDRPMAMSRPFLVSNRPAIKWAESRLDWSPDPPANQLDPANGNGQQADRREPQQESATQDDERETWRSSGPGAGAIHGRCRRNAPGRTGGRRRTGRAAARLRSRMKLSLAALPQDGDGR